MDPRKQAICNALAAFIRQRPGLEWCNYATSNHAESVAAYRSEQRRIARDKRDAESLLMAVRHNDSITADAMLAAADGRGRLEIVTRHDDPLQVLVTWTTGQYWCVEFRSGVARYLAQLLWNWQRENMPQVGAAPVGSGKAEAGMYYDASAGRSLSAGDWLRRKFRQDFGSAMQKRWFD